VPALGDATEVPPTFAAVLDGGRLCGGHPFARDDGWCRRCDRWKPVFASHCDQCGRCAYWMDHHCNFAGQCVGFRNLRCYIVSLCYGNMLCALLALLTVRRLWLLGWPAADEDQLMCITWCVILLFFWHSAFKFLWASGWLVMTGWRSRVLNLKLVQFQSLAIDMGVELPWRRRGLPSKNDSQLQRAFADIIMPRTVYPSGPFLEPGQLGVGTMELFGSVFGEPLSWRWLLPFCPGGAGDPLRPRGFSQAACERWLALADAVAGGAAARGAKDGKPYAMPPECNAMLL